MGPESLLGTLAKQRRMSVQVLHPQDRYMYLNHSSNCPNHSDQAHMYTAVHCKVQILFKVNIGCHSLLAQECVCQCPSKSSV